MFFLATIVFAFFPAFVSCKHFGKAPYFQNPLTSLLLQDKGFADLTGLKPVPTHPSHPQYKTAEEGTGWMYTYVYNGTDCDPNKAAVEYGMVTDQCFTASHSTQNSSLTVMITCFEDEAVTLFYNSTDCNPETSWGPDWLELNTCFQFNSSVDGSGLYGLDSFEIFCVQDSTLPVSGGEWVILSSYAEDNCTDIYSFNAFLDNVCYQFPYEAFRFNYPNETYYNTTDRAYEYSVDCSNSYHSRVHELPTTCYNDYETGDDDVVQIESNIASFYYSPANFTSVPTSYPTPIPTSYPTPIPTSYPTSIPTSYPTATPTAKTKVTAYPTEIPTTEPTFQSTAVPTVAATAKTTSVPSPFPSTDPTTQPTAVPTTTPTVQPTAVPTRVPTTQGTLAPTLVPTSSPTFPAYLIFTSNITLSGVSSTSLDQASQQAVVNTTAISMNIPNNQVSFVSAYSVPSSSPVSVSVSASAVRGHTRGGKILSTASSSIVAITKVKAPLSDPSQSTALYTQLTSALNQSVSSNEFSETLQSLSKATGATQTMNANATGVWSSAATVSSVATSSSSSSNDDGLSGGAIAGIVIGVVAFMALMLGGGYYLYAKKNSQSSGSSNEAPAVTIMMKSNPTSSPPDEFAGVSPMQQSSLPPPVVAVAIEEGLPDSQKTKQLK